MAKSRKNEGQVSAPPAKQDEAQAVSSAIDGRPAGNNSNTTTGKADERREGLRAETILMAMTVIISVAGILVTVLLAINTQKELKIPRVQSGVIDTNKFDYSNPEAGWIPWEQPLPGNKTIYVGIQRKVKFRTAFKNPPETVAALSLINLPAMDERLKEQRHPNVTDDHWKQLLAANKEEWKRLRDTHVVMFAKRSENDPESEFLLQVGIGLPMDSGTWLIKHLRAVSPTPEDIEEYIHAKNVSPKDGKLNAHEKWMLNFYERVGTFNVVWTATATE